MGDLVLKGATSGQITVTPTAIAGTNTLTLPAKTGNIITSADSGTVTQAMLAAGVAGNGPLFFASISSPQNVTTGTYTKLAFDTESYDTANCYDTSLYRFTPNVAGHYQVNACINWSGATLAENFLVLYKNGNDAQRGIDFGPAYGASMSTIIYLNGSTDYIEMYVDQITGGTRTVNQGSNVSYWNAFLARSA